MSGHRAKGLSTLGTIAVFAAAMPSASAWAGDWKSSLSLGLRGTLTDNVRAAPSGEEEADLYVTATPAISMSRQGSRLRANLTYAPSVTVYANQTESSQLANSLAANGSLEAVSDFFFIDARATISQTFLTPFGALPADIGTLTENRAEAYGLSVSPYIKSTLGDRVSYELRNTTSYAATDSSLTSGSTFVRWVARASGPITQRLDWTLEGTRNTTYSNYSNNQDSQYESVARALLTYGLSSELSVTLRGGYEKNNYNAPAPDIERSFYGLGFSWAPTSRTSMQGYVEDRFFGVGYNLSATHRHRRSAISLYGSRDTSSYPQLLFTLPPGDTRSLLDAALTAQIPDPAKRQAAIEQFLTITGTPSTLLLPNTFYSERVNLVESVGGSIALLGVRNTVTLSVSWLESEPISQFGGTPLPPELAGLDRFATYGTAVNWTHRLTGRTNTSLLLSRYYTETIDNPEDNSTNTAATLQLNTQFGSRTTGSVGVRWTQFESALTGGHTEHAIFAAGNHVF
jgi:uncharacterized protein (PEP-CTERM system associated)